MQPGLFFFSLYHTNKAVKDFNVLMALAVYDGAFSDLDMVNQFLNDFPVKLLHIQIAADDACPLSDIFNLLLGFSFLCQKNLQTLCLLDAFLFTFLNQDRKGIVIDYAADLIRLALQLSVLVNDFQRAEQIVAGIIGKDQSVRPVIDKTIFCGKAVIEPVQFSLFIPDGAVRCGSVHLQVNELLDTFPQTHQPFHTDFGGGIQVRPYHAAVFTEIYSAVHHGVGVVFHIGVGGDRGVDGFALAQLWQLGLLVSAVNVLHGIMQLIGKLQPLDGIHGVVHAMGTSRGGSKSTVEPTKWGHTTIKKILTTQEYCGDVINFKSYSKSYKMKRRIENPEENRAIFLNVHEPIIDRPTWEKVQALKAGTRRKRPTVTQEPSVFSGYLKCPECGGNLNFHFNQGNHDIKFFSCQNHNSGLRKCSSTHYIRLDFLEQVVLYEVHRLACFANEYENDFIKAMVGRSAKVAENDRVRKKRELDGLLARDKELDMLFERLYEDNVSGKIDDARFAKMSKRYEQEQGENAKKIKALRLELKKLEDKRMDVDTFLETVRRYTDATAITKRMVAELIEYIEVYPAVKEDGVTNQRVTIHYNCIGAFEVPDRRKIPERDILLETRKGVALSYAPAV